MYDDQQQAHNLFQHLRLVNMSDDLAEESDSVVEAGCLEESLGVQVNHLVKQRGELGHDVNVNSVGEGVVLARFQSRLHCFGQDHVAECIDRATDFLSHLRALLSQ